MVVVSSHARCVRHVLVFPHQEGVYVAEERENKNLTKNKYLQAESAAGHVQSALHSLPVQWKRVPRRALRKRRRSKGLLQHASSLHPRRRKKTCTVRFSIPAPVVAHQSMSLVPGISGFRCRPSQDRDKPKESKAKDQRAEMAASGVSLAWSSMWLFSGRKRCKAREGKEQGRRRIREGSS